MDEFDESTEAPPPKPSKTPSWIMLGFVLGALFVWALPHRQEKAATAPVVVPLPPPAATQPLLTDVEAVFASWGKYAVWADDTTYVGMFNSGSRTIRDCFEVLRRGDRLFFRSIPRPTNLRALDGIPPECPMEFLNPVPEVRGLFGERLPPPVGERLSRPAEAVPGE